MKVNLLVEMSGIWLVYALYSSVYMNFVPPAVPPLTVGASIMSPTVPFTAGQSYTLTCTATVTGGDTLDPPQWECDIRNW